MSAYIPVVSGETSSLRESVESMLTSTPGAISEQISTLDQSARQRGRFATFGAEIEFQLIPDPSTEQVDAFEGDKEELCDHVIREAQGDIAKVTWDKGEVIHPDRNPGVIYRTYNFHEFLDSDMVEIRTAPAEAMESIERYWKTIQAIGTVARRYGYLGLIQSTHMNAAVWQEAETEPTSDQPGFVHFAETRNYAILAATQANLVAANPLQIDAGLETGITILEAYPNRNASTTVHDQRLEFRHPTVGLIDPRIDVLAVLGGLNQAISNDVPATIQSRIHPCKTIELSGRYDSSLGFVLKRLALWDSTSQKFVLPANLDHTARYRLLSKHIDSLTHSLIGAVVTNPNHQEQVLRNALSGFGLKGTTLTVDPRNPYATKLQMFARSIDRVDLVDDKARVIPESSLDSPAIHAVRRSHIARSSIVRRLLGDAARDLTPAQESIQSRQDLIDRQVVVLD